MMTATAKRVFQILLLLLFFFVLQGVSQEEVEYSSKVKLVEVVIQATDARGQHIEDLSLKEISITTGGRQRKAAFLTPVSHVEKFDFPGNFKVCEESSFNSEAPRRYILIILHKVVSRLGSFNRARAALKEFFNSSSSQSDYYSIVSFDKGLLSQMEFTNDRKRILQAVADLHLRFPQVKARDEFYKYLQEIAAENRMRRGKLVIILMTEGMKGIAFSELKDDFDEAINHLQSANIRVFGIDTGGLSIRDPGASVAALDPRMASKVRQSFNNAQVTDPTGGTSFRRRNDIKAMLDDVHHLISFHYVTGFYLDKDEELTRPLKLEIQTTRPGVELRYKDSVQTLFKTK